MRFMMFKVASLVAVSIFALACGPSGTLQVEGQLSTSTAALTQTSLNCGGLAIAGGDLMIKKVTIAVSEIELEGGGEDEREAEMGAAKIAVTLDGKPTPITVDTVDAGSYHTLGIEMETSLAGASIVVEGSHKGNAFTFRSALKKEVEFRLSPEVNVPANGSAAVAVSFDVQSWFKSGSGVLDPSKPANQSRIEAQILSSLAANAVIEDGDEDDDD